MPERDENPLKTISIIVPVYNAQDHLAQTLDSLLCQTNQDIEIICVDDGSQDHSLQILHAYKKAHPEIMRVFSQKNQGVSIARNLGIEQAKGDIIMFVDADDKLLPHACMKVKEVFEQQTPEVFTFGFMCEPPEAMPLGMAKELKPANKVYDQFAPDLLFKEKARPYACRTAFSRDLIEKHHIRFEPHIRLGEDQVIYFVAYPLSCKTVLSSEQFYIYNMHHDSATHANAHEKNSAQRRLEQHMLVVEAIQKEWRERGLTDFCRAALLEWTLDLVLFDMLSLDTQKQAEYFKRLMDDYRAYYDEDPSGVARNPSTKNCLQDIESALMAQDAGKQTRSFVSTVHLALFYYHRYGFIRCFQQVLIGLGLLKKWK